MIRLICAFFLCFISLSSWGQIQLIKKDNKEYLVHITTQGNTLYQLSRAYNCTVDDLLNSNPGIERGLNEDDTLFIPVYRKNVSHRVKAKETLYSISKLYYTTVDEIIRNNEGSENGIQIDQVLNITNAVSPITLLDETNEEQQQENALKKNENINFKNEKINDSILKYKVNKGETLYSISKRYRVNKSQIIELNNLLKPSLTEGQIILIPLTQEKVFTPFQETDSLINTTKFTQWSLENKEVYNIVFFLPLSLDSSTSKSLQYSFAATDFYMGSKMALDILEKSGLNANVSYIDYLNTKQPIEDQLKELEQQKIDLIFAPWDSAYFNVLKSWSIEHEVMVVYPTNCNYSILFNNPYALSYATYDQQLIEGLGISCSKSSFKSIILHSDTITLKNLEGIFSKSYEKGNNDYSLIEANTKNYKQFIHSKDTVNLIVLSKNEKFILKIWNEIKELENVRLIGMECWKDLEDVSQNIDNPICYYYQGNNDFEYKESKIKVLNRLFRNNYQCDLSYHACFGFDITHNVISKLILRSTSSLGSMSELQPVQRLAGHGIENSHSYFLKYKDFRTHRIINE